MVDKGYMIPHGFAAYNCPLKPEASRIDFLRTPILLHKETLEHLEQLMQGTLEEERVTSISKEKRMGIPVENGGGKCMDRRTAKKEVRDTQPRPSCSLLG